MYLLAVINYRSKQRYVQISHPLQNNSPNNYSSDTKTSAQGTSNNFAHQNFTDSSSSVINKLMSSFLDQFKARIHPLLALLTKVVGLVAVYKTKKKKKISSSSTKPHY